LVQCNIKTASSISPSAPRPTQIIVEEYLPRRSAAEREAVAAPSFIAEVTTFQSMRPFAELIGR
jgi:hypothetical protein